VALSGDDLEMLAASTDGMATLLRRLLALVPGPRIERPPTHGYHAIPLGSAQAAVAHRDVFLALAPLDPSFLLFLAERRTARQRALVLVPSAWRLQLALLDRHGPSDHVEIVCLDHLLAVKDDDIVLATSPDASAPSAPVLVSHQSIQPFCRLLDPSGLRDIDVTEYQSILASVQYSLVLDVAVMALRGGYAAYVPGARGPIEKRLTRNGALILGELMFTGQPTAADRLRWTGLSHPIKVFERSRSIIEADTKARHPRAWRLFHAHKPPGSSVVELAFRPPEGFRYALLLSPQASTHK
jgi:hypothetical protein